tara:strand:+ start:371 stop:1126 length:756 start_codon:yes stop_codon:yes gene_type:complete
LLNKFSFSEGAQEFLVELRVMGDSALSLVLGETITPDINRQVHRISRSIVSRNIEGILDVLSTYSGIVIHYNPLQMSFNELKNLLIELCNGNVESANSKTRIVGIPTLYGGEYGPDLSNVSTLLKISESDIVSLHTGNDYLVYGLGFSPGFPYLGGLSAELYCERLATPRLEVPIGSVAIAETQTGIYPISSPGGWRLIGRTPVKLFDPNNERPTLLEPGDLVRFRSIDIDEFNEISNMITKNEYKPELLT